jgi:hypothetical protein
MTAIMPIMTMNMARHGPMAVIAPALKPLQHFSLGNPILSAALKASLQ